MTPHCEMIVGTTSTLGAALMAVLPTDPATLEALAKWPATLMLAGISVYSIYSLNRNSERSARSQDRQSQAIERLIANLNQRPCIRQPEND